jgi:uncharacterized membrane protein YedE/YeeE
VEALIRRRTLLRMGILVAMSVWFAWTVADLPPFSGPDSEAATNRLLTVSAALGTTVYAVAAVRYWRLFRNRRSLLAAAVVACFVLLSEAMIGVAVTGERKWHASWWEWHGLIVTAYLIVGFNTRIGRSCASASTAAACWSAKSEATAMSRTLLSATPSIRALARRVWPLPAEC